MGLMYDLYLCSRLNGPRENCIAPNARVEQELLTLFMEYTVTVESLLSQLSGFKKVELILFCPQVR